MSNASILIRHRLRHLMSGLLFVAFVGSGCDVEGPAPGSAYKVSGGGAPASPTAGGASDLAKQRDARNNNPRPNAGGTRVTR